MEKKDIKRICFVFVILSFCFYINIESNKLRSNYIMVNATPITNKTIVLDAGHGLPDQGGEGFEGTTEQKINLSIVIKLKDIIEQNGAKVILTRSDENGIYDIDNKSIRNKKVSDMKNRVYLGNNSNANIYLSIHLNKYPNPIYKGWQAFYQTGNDISRNIAKSIQEQLNKNIDYDNKREVMSIKDVYIMDKVNIPTVVVECGFLSNPEEEKQLQESDYQNKLAWGIYMGLENHFLEETINERKNR